MRLPRPLVPRFRFDIGWRDLAAGLISCVTEPGYETARDGAQGAWNDSDEVMACLSVRTGFDLLLQALKLPMGSEVLMSAISIAEIAQIIREHGLVPVPVDLDPDTLEPQLDVMRDLITPKSRMVLVAHLFGSQIRMQPFAEFAVEHKLLLVEDCAQAFTGAREDVAMHETSLAAMFSFGPIKTATALGGAIMIVRDTELRTQMRELESVYVSPTRSEFATRVVRFSILKFLSLRRVFGLLYWFIGLLGKELDAVVGGAARGFPAGDLMRQIRRRPSAPLLMLLARRLRNYSGRSVKQRTRAGLLLTKGLAGGPLYLPGSDTPNHTWWVFPASTPGPLEFCQQLRRKGFDATPGASAMRVIPDASGNTDTCPGAQQVLSNVLYLPLQAEFSDADIDRLINALLSVETELSARTFHKTGS